MRKFLFQILVGLVLKSTLLAAATEDSKPVPSALVAVGTDRSTTYISAEDLGSIPSIGKHLVINMDKLTIRELEVEIVRILDSRYDEKSAIEKLSILKASSRKFNVIKPSLRKLAAEGLIGEIHYSAMDSYKMRPRAVENTLREFVCKNIAVATSGPLSPADEISDISRFFTKIATMHEKIPDLDGILCFEEFKKDDHKIRKIKEKITTFGHADEITTEIDVINLCGLKIYDSDIRSLLGVIMTLDSLELLNLAANVLTRDSLGELKTILSLPALKFLNVRYNPVAQTDIILEFYEELRAEGREKDSCKLVWVAPSAVEGGVLGDEDIRVHRAYDDYVARLRMIEADKVFHKDKKSPALY